MKLRKVIVAFLALICICSVFCFCTLDIANAEGVRTVYATTSASIKQGSYGYLYVYLDDLTDLSALNVSVYYDAEKITVKSAYNQVSSVVNDIATGDGCVNASYIFDGKGSAKKTNLFYIYYQVSSSAEIGNTYFDIVVTEAYSSTLEEMNFSGSRCSLEIAESTVSKTCYIYSTSTLSTSVGEEFELSYRFSTYQIASGSMSIQYDPELFEVVYVTNGSFLTDKIADINTALDGSVYISFVGTTYISKYDIVTVRFKTLKNVSETSDIKLIVSELCDKELNLYSCSGYTTKANIVFDETYAEDAPSMSVSASYNAQSDKVTATIKLDENSRLGAGDFVLKFDSDALAYNSAQKGFAPNFFNINDKDVADGILKFSIISLTDITDEQLVLTVVFDAKHGCQDTTSDIEISGSGLTDSLVNTIQLNFVDASVTIPLRHTASDTAVVENRVEPGCTTNGSYDNVVYCSDCGEELSRGTVVIPATGHSAGSVVVENNVAPTCTVDGHYDDVVYCTVCEEELSRDTVVIPALGHTYSSIITAPTCTEQGYTTYTCHCGDSYVDSYVDALGHYEVPHPPKAPTCTEIGWNEFVTCSRCDYTTYQEVPATGHSHNAVVTDPTCTEQGYTTYTCHCGDTYVTNYVDALGHYETPHPPKAPTCTEIGWNEFVTCGRCDYTTYEEIPATGHSYHVAITSPTCTTEGYTTYTCHCGDSYVSDYVGSLGHTDGAVIAENIVDATCTTDGFYDLVTYCSVCEEKIFTAGQIIYALGHTDGEWITDSNPTCTQPGSRHQVCATCGETIKTGSIPANGHSFTNYVPNGDATCTEDGTITAKCDYCDETQTITHVGSAFGHNYNAVVTVPTCTAQGYTTYTCHCGDTYVADYVEPTGHTYDSGVVTTNPTCTTDGIKTFTCHCGHFYTEVVEKLGHDKVHHEAQAPTCTAFGWNEYVTCSRCDYTTYVEIPATGHNYNVVVTAPTCTTQGYTTHTCHCGDSYVDSYVDALGHTEVVDKAVAPTCTTTGLTEGKHCSVCNEVLIVQAVVPALGHIEGQAVEENRVEADCVNTGSYDTVIYCTICNTELERVTTTISALGHTPSQVVVENNVAPNCTEDGRYDNVVYCTVCHVELSRNTVTVPALGHTESEVVIENNVAPSCTDNGSYDNVVYCTVCSAEVSRDTVVVPALGHSYSAVVTAPTCTEQGYTTYTCSRCDDNYKSNYVDAIGHVWSWVIDEEPTYTETGLQHQECSACHATQNENTVIPVKTHEHNYVSEVTIVPTCTQKGVETFTCSICDDTYTQDIAATGHTYNTVVTDPTCTEKGYTTYTCHCGDTYVADEVAALGHTESEVVVENNVEPNCTENGSYDNVIYCTVCNAELSRNTVVASATGHKYNAVVTNPTCTADGYTTFTCHCGDTYVSDYVDAVGHYYGAWVETTAPTCTTAGEERRDCNKCDHYETQAISATGHTEGTAVVENNVAPTCTADGSYDNVVYCTVCDAELSRTTVVVDTLDHTHSPLVVENNVAPTCTVDGSYDIVVYCAVCDTELVRDKITVPAAGHTAGSVVVENDVAPTCTVDGSYDNATYCTVCETELSRVTIIVTAPGHSFGEWTVPTAPTCTEAGEERRDCNNCDHYETKELAALGHDYSNGGSCALCGELSDGVVTGIVVGSAVAVGGCGFSLFWFVLRKKRLKK